MAKSEETSIRFRAGGLGFILEVTGSQKSRQLETGWTMKVTEKAKDSHTMAKDTHTVVKD